MIDETLLADLLRRQHQNQLALAAAVEEIALWLETNGGSVTASNARDALKTLDDTQAHISQALARMP
ncbi:hypothetical protein [Pseudomonas putida]